MATQRKRAKFDNSAVSAKMEILDKLHDFPWCKPNWNYSNLAEELKQQLNELKNMPKAKLEDNVDEIIRKSKDFPIKFPIETVRLQQLKLRRPIENLKRNISSTYPILHERVLLLMLQFLEYKRKHGSTIEKEFYKEMTVPQLIDRILKKRAVSFLRADDKYLLISGERGSEGWEAVGTPQQEPPLLLENCLSYDEMKLSAMLFVSGYTECINDGMRKNMGVVREDNIEKEAVIIGLIGPRLKRKGRMAYEDMIITKEQNTSENGFGEVSESSRRMWRQLWANFYEVPSYTYDKLLPTVNTRGVSMDKKYLHRHVKISGDSLFDNEVYYKRLVILAETTLVEAQARGRAAGKDVFLNIIGCGLGVWKVSKHQIDVYVLSFLERIKEFLSKGAINNITDINFGYIEPCPTIKALFSDSKELPRRIFLKQKEHPKGGINVQLENRQPSTRLSGQHEGKLLVLTYPWDGNAHPGNEFWMGKLGSSGDPAAACATQVSELHNAHVNPNVASHNTHVAGRAGLVSLSEYSLAVAS